MANKIGILISNLGTPDAPTPKALRRYLKEFLSDSRVVRLPKLLWQPILNGIILPFRPRRSADLYQRIWTERGSPLRVFSEQLTAKVQQELDQNYPDRYIVGLGMRYGNPSIPAALNTLRQANIQKLLVLPLYPQFSTSTTASTFDAVTAVLQTWPALPELHFINHYFDNSAYIDAIAKSIKRSWEQERGEKLIFSFHGVPKQFVLKGDPYFNQCKATSEAIAAQLQLTENDWQMVFQSRFGKAEWLTPYCDITLQELAQQGLKRLDIVCPGFAVDCLETLEEIAIQNQELFIAAGGESLRYIAALNDTNDQVKLISGLCRKNA